MAQKKGGGTAKNTRDSAGRRLGVKKFGGQKVIAGNIIVRQRGTKFKNGNHVLVGKDHTLYAVLDGTVIFTSKTIHGKKFVVVHVQPDYNPLAS